jgi:hypothetical protein
LRSVLSEPVVLVVADGKGGTGSNGDGVIDLGLLPGGRAARVLRGSMRALKTLRALRARSVHFHDPELIPLGLLLRLLGHQVIYDAH